MKLLWEIFWKERELKRQILHLGVGLFYAVCFALGWIDGLVATIIFVLAVIVSFYLKKQEGFWDRFVLLLEREHHFLEIPLRGAIFFALGVTITIMLFEPMPALAGIVTLAFADSLGTLYGKYLGRVKIPWNKDKHLEGPIIGGALAAAVCFTFLPILPAIVGAYVGAFVDTLNLHFKGVEIDDNLLIPILTAAFISLF